MKKPASPIGKTSQHQADYTSNTRLPGCPMRIKRVTPKYVIALRILLHRSLVELEALSLYGELNLHSTISFLSNQKDIRFHRKPEKHKHRGGKYTHFTRYKLYEEDRNKALSIVALWGGE